MSLALSRSSPRWPRFVFAQLVFGLCGFLVVAAPVVSALEIIEADVCVYGGTSAGVVAAVQTSRMGKSAVLVVVNHHLGGLSSGGLGQTDIGNKAAIGGISRDFYRRLGQHYGQAEAWTFEPHVAEGIFNSLAQEAAVPVYFDKRLASVTKDGARIVEIAMERGVIFRAKMFIDASYEGDLLARAGVSYHVGREANSVYGETLNGIRASTPSHQFVVPVDPYVVMGDSASGLLPLIQPGDGGVPGEGDARVQAYNFRMCLTRDTANFRAIDPPPNYDPARYELLARYIEARVARGDSLQLRHFMTISLMPNGKTDINNQGAISTDYIGHNYDYPEADYTRRAEIWKAHEEYIRGLFTFLGSSPRVPASLRAEMRSWGLAKDEFVDTGGWPHQMYVREARRMISDYVMTERNCRGAVKASDPVGLAAYNMDSHNCQRILQNGEPRNEGDVQVGVSPYPISYRAIVPKPDECSNLLVPICLSSSHIAYGSIRMEPVFMILGQSAATAACFAIDDDLSVQQVDYQKLQLQLRADGQILQWGSGSDDTGIINDDADIEGVALVGSWAASTSVAGFYGVDYLHDGNTGKGAQSARFTPTIPTNGNYQVYLRWTAHPNRASNVPIDVVHAEGVSTFTVDQRANNGQWRLLGTFPFQAGTQGSLLIRTTGTDGYVIADAARFDTPDSNALPVAHLIVTDGSAGEWQSNSARYTVVRTGEPTAPLTLAYISGGTASNGLDYQALSGTVTIPAGSIATEVRVRPIPDDLVEGSETVVLELLPLASYRLGSLHQAIVTLRDLPIDEWKKAQFAAEELTTLADDQADPDEDGRCNVVEYAMGTDPKVFERAQPPVVSITDNRLTVVYTRAKRAVDLEWHLEISSDLFGWASGSELFQETVIADDGVLQRRFVRDLWPLSAGSMRFLKVQVTRP